MTILSLLLGKLLLRLLVVRHLYLEHPVQNTPWTKISEFQNGDFIFQDYYYRTFTMPNNFDAKSKETIRIFGERLQNVLEAAKSRSKEIATKKHDTTGNGEYDLMAGGPLYCDVTTAKKLAERLNVTEANISRYIHGKNQSVPTHFFIHLHDIFGVTPHYLTGYTNDMYASLRLDDNREIVRKDGLPVEIKDPMTPIFSMQEYVRSQFTNLLFESPEHFSILTDLLCADENVRSGGFAILRTYLDVHRRIEIGQENTKAK